MVDNLHLTSRELQALSTQSVIVDAAEELFLRDGFAGSSLGGIASAAKVSKGLILHHFKSKEALWSAVIERQQEEMQDALLAICDQAGEGIDGLRSVFQRYFTWLGEHPQHLRFLLLRALEGGEPAIDTAFSCLLPLIESTQNSHALRDDLPAAVLLQAMIGQIRAWHAGKALRSRDNRIDFNDEQACTALLDIFIDGAAAPC